MIFSLLRGGLLPKYSFNIDKPIFFNLQHLVMIHGWRELAPFEYKDNLLYFAAYIEDDPVDIFIKEEADFIACSFASHGPKDEIFKEKVCQIISRVLSLDRDLDSLIDKSIAAGKEFEALVKDGWNRLLKSPTLFEDFCKVLFTTNCSWALTKKISTTICSDRFSDLTPSGKYPFPRPEMVNKYSAKELKEVICVGYRNESLKNLSKKFCEHSDTWLDVKNGDKAFDDVMALKGFGHYAASHMMIIIDFFKEIPTDSVVIKYLKKTHNIKKKDAASFMKEHYKVWENDYWWGFKLESILKFMENED